QPAPHRSHNLGLASDDPSFGGRRGELGDGQRTAIRSDDVFCTRAKGFGHGFAHNWSRQTWFDKTRPPDTSRTGFASRRPGQAPTKPTSARRTAHPGQPGDVDPEG